MHGPARTVGSHHPIVHAHLLGRYANHSGACVYRYGPVNKATLSYRAESEAERNRSTDVVRRSDTGQPPGSDVRGTGGGTSRGVRGRWFSFRRRGYTVWCDQGRPEWVSLSKCTLSHDRTGHQAAEQRNSSPSKNATNHASHHGSWGSVHAQLLHVSVHARLLHGDPVGHQRIAEHAGKYDKRLDRALTESVLELLLH